MSEKKTNNWSDPDTVRMLYLSVLAQTEDVTYSAQKIADFMGITYKAAHHQIARVKADIEALQNGTFTLPQTSTTATTAPATASLTTTPATTTINRPNTRKRAAAKISSDEAAVEDVKSPNKRTRTSTRSRSKRVSAAAAAKEKQVGGDEDGSNADDERESATEAANILLGMSKGMGGVMEKGAAEKEDEDGDMTEIEEDAE